MSWNAGFKNWKHCSNSSLSLRLWLSHSVRVRCSVHIRQKNPPFGGVLQNFWFNWTVSSYKDGSRPMQCMQCQLLLRQTVYIAIGCCTSPDPHRPYVISPQKSALHAQPGRLPSLYHRRIHLLDESASGTRGFIEKPANREQVPHDKIAIPTLGIHVKHLKHLKI